MYDIVEYESPLIDSEGTIYITDLSGVYAIYGSAPPAESPWPMYRHDALRTGNRNFNPAPMLVPSGVAASKGTYYDYVRVSWNPVPNATCYEVWRNTANTTAGATRIRRQAGTVFLDNTMDPGRIYYYWNKAKTPVTISDFSSSNYGCITP